MFETRAVVDAARRVGLARAWHANATAANRPRPIVLCDLVERLDLLLSAVFARRFVILPAPNPQAQDVLSWLRARRPAPMRGSNPVPATDGVSIWLPPALPGVEHLRAGAIYRALALVQASRAQRGAARVAEQTGDALVRSCFLLVEAWSVQECLAAMLPGMRPALAMLADEASAPELLPTALLEWVRRLVRA